MAELAPGEADRVVRVERELSRTQVRSFEALELAEEVELWPALWRKVLALLEERGTAVRVVPPCFAEAVAPGDLGLVQSVLGGQAPHPSSRLVGDGSLVVLCAETSWELAQASAAWLRADTSSSTVVLRGGDVAALEAALAARGLPGQGLVSTNAWRPALQVLPLALELAFEPRDPYRVLELLTLPQGPFHGRIGRELARAVAEAPGVGGRPWHAAKQRLRDAGLAEEQLRRVVDWFEQPGHDAARAAPIQGLLDVAARVREWLVSGLAAAHAALAATPAGRRWQSAVESLGAAFAQLESFEQALRDESRQGLRLVEARQLLDEASGAGQRFVLEGERAGRIDHVESPASLRRARDVVLWWHCVAGARAQPGWRRWRGGEQTALAAAGIRLVDPRVHLAAEARSWRQVVLAARRRLVLAMPRAALGQELAPHPIWDEISGCLGRPVRELEQLRLEARDWLGEGGAALLPAEIRRASLVELDALPLPEARAEWSVDPGVLHAPRAHSASSLQALLGCTLQWVLRYAAGVRARGIHSLATGPQLNGQLGHRLVEELHGAGALRDPEAARAAASAHFDRLVREEAAVLLRAGEDSELAQLKEQLCRSIESLAQLLASLGLEIVAVEESTRVSWRGAELEGRPDLLLKDRSGREVVLDLKWGSRRYRELLEEGRAVQLGSYVALRRAAAGGAAWPAAAYFSLSRGEVLTTESGLFGEQRGLEGPCVLETWRRLEATLPRIEAPLAAGRIAVTGLRRSLPLVPAGDRPALDGDLLRLPAGDTCQYCDYPALCGRSWEEYG